MSTRDLRNFTAKPGNLVGSTTEKDGLVLGVSSGPRVRKGRREAGVVAEWLERCRLSKQVVDAINYNLGLTVKVLSIPVHVGNMGNTAGCAWDFCKEYPDGLIELNEKILLEGREKDLTETLLHEIGHCIHNLESGIPSFHNKAWRSVMKRLGSPNEERGHSIPYLSERFHKGTCSVCKTQVRRKKMKDILTVTCPKKCKGFINLSFARY